MRNIARVIVHLTLVFALVAVSTNNAYAADDGPCRANASKAEIEACKDFLTRNSIPFWAPFVGSSCSADPASVSGTSSIDRLLQTIALRESGGDPKAENPSGSASGKYQYVDGTWQSRKTIYPPAGDYSHASNAPESIQDAVAYIEYSQKLKDNNGNLENTIISHYLGHVPTSDAEWNSVPAGGNSLTPRQYVDGFMAAYNSNEGSNISLHYTEAPDFAKYASGKTTSTTSTPSATTATCGGASGDGGYTDVNGIKMYYQYKEPWASQRYGIGTIEECGCGPTSLAIAVSTLTGNDITPKAMADWFVDNGGQVGNGSCASNWIWESKSALFTSTYGVTIEPIGNSADSIKSALGGGGALVIMSQDQRGMFTSGGHIMLARGVAGNNILVADPNNEEYTNREGGFTNQQIEAGLRAAWVIKKQG